MQTNGDFEKVVAIETVKDYINMYGWNETTAEELRVKKRAIDYYLRAVIENRPSLAAMADNMLKEIDENQTAEWGKNKAVVSKILGIAVSNDVTIEEWRGFVKVADDIAKAQ
jgi:hypothetical protein